MKLNDLQTLSIEQLTVLHDSVCSFLTAKLQREKQKLDRQLSKLTGGIPAAQIAHQVNEGKKRARRPYPPVRPKYRNPTNRRETWAGRGKRPRWLVSQLSAGKRMQDFLIEPKAGSSAIHSKRVARSAVGKRTRLPARSRGRR